MLVYVSHFAIDMWKSYRPENVAWFALDQILHLGVIAVVAWIWSDWYGWNMPFEINVKFIAMAVAALVCWKPANILIFVCMQHYEALGLLIAAKSIMRFSDKETSRTEYVLAGTLLSIFIAVVVGMMVMIVSNL